MTTSWSSVTSRHQARPEPAPAAVVATLTLIVAGSMAILGVLSAQVHGPLIGGAFILASFLCVIALWGRRRHAEWAPPLLAATMLCIAVGAAISVGATIIVVAGSSFGLGAPVHRLPIIGSLSGSVSILVSLLLLTTSAGIYVRVSRP